MTPRLFSFMLERWRDQVKREDRRGGEIVAMLYNINRDTEKDPRGIDWQDVYTEWKEEHEQTEEEMLQVMQMFAASTEGLSH